MTASAGLHNMPAAMRPAVIAEPGTCSCAPTSARSNRGCWPRCRGDRRWPAATARGRPVRAGRRISSASTGPRPRWRCSARCTGRRPATAPRALRGLERGVSRSPWRTSTPPTGPASSATTCAPTAAASCAWAQRRRRSIDLDRAATRRRSRAAARGRYGRNALVQGAAAELFKVWAVTVRARGAALDARIVLCLHDELLVQAPIEHGEVVGPLVDAACRRPPTGGPPRRGSLRRRHQGSAPLVGCEVSSPAAPSESHRSDRVPPRPARTIAARSEAITARSAIGSSAGRGQSAAGTPRRAVRARMPRVARRAPSEMTGKMLASRQT